MTKIEDIQTILGVPVDGKWGPISQAALDKQIRVSREVESGDFHVASTALHPFVVVAAEWVGRGETSRNRFKGDKVVWADTNYPDGWEDRQPYCAAFQCFVVAEAKRRGAKPAALPKSAGVSEMRNWARAKGYSTTKPKPGDHGTLLPSGTSHVFLVESVGKGIVHTIEGNTDGAGSREGDGFWRKTRRIAGCDFFRIPVTA